MASWSAQCSGSARCGSSLMPACPALVPMKLCWAHSSFSLARWSQTTLRQSSGECPPEKCVTVESMKQMLAMLASMLATVSFSSPFLTQGIKMCFTFIFSIGAVKFSRFQMVGSTLERHGRPPRGRSHHRPGNHQVLLLHLPIFLVAATVS